MDDASSKYSDIIDLPHHVSEKHPHMSLYDRAAQFAPFAALTGYDAQIEEAARITDSRAVLDEAQKDAIGQKLGILSDMLSASGKDSLPSVVITYFVSDARKSGGEYRRAEGRIKKIDSLRRLLVMEDGTQIPVADIHEINY